MPTFNPVAASDLLFTIMSGVHPDATELQTLVSFANQQYAYGQQIGVMDPFVYAYEALGAALSQQKLFYSGFEPGPSPDQTSDLNFVTKVYKQIFGHDAAPPQTQVFVNQLNYLDTLYSAAGLHNPNLTDDYPNLVARAAVFGTMTGIEAEMTQVPIVGIGSHAV